MDRMINHYLLFQLVWSDDHKKIKSDCFEVLCRKLVLHQIICNAVTGNDIMTSVWSALSMYPSIAALAALHFVSSLYQLHCGMDIALKPKKLEY